MKHTLKELVRVKAFLLAGTTVTIVEEKVGGAGALASHWLEGSGSTSFPMTFFSGWFHTPAPSVVAWQSLSRKDKVGWGPSSQPPLLP